MFRRKKSINKKRLEHKLYLAREDPEPIFDLSDCDLPDVPNGIYSLCKVFLKKSLKLQNNQLTSLSGGGDLRDLCLLKVLDLHNNAFTSLPNEIYLLSNLEELYINENQLKKIPDTLCHLISLRILNLSQNSLKYIPENIGNLVNLQKISLTCNKHMKYLPKSICKAQRLFSIILDAENFLYPPNEICENGTEAIMRFICRDTDFPYIHPNELGENINLEEKKETEDEPDYYQQQKLQEFLEIEKNNEILQRQEIELANAQKANREKLLAAISQQQIRFDLELTKIHQEKEHERFRLIEQLQEAENNADIAINKLLALNKEPLDQLLEKERQEEERLLTAVNRYNETLRKDDILVAMQDILRQETEKFNQFDKDRIEAFRSILEQEMETDSKLSQILQDKDIYKAELVTKLQEDYDLQKAAVGTLLERGDARSWALLQQVRLVASQLVVLTNIEMDRRKLRIDEQLNDLSEKRINLSILLMDLLEQQKERRSQLLSTIKTMAEYNDESIDDFWLRQYQRLLDKLPEGLSQAQKNIDPRLAHALLANGVIHCLPFLAKLTQSQYDTKSITEDELIDSGITDANDRLHILDAFRLYSKEKSLYLYEENQPSAPPVESAGASAPLPEEIRTINTFECVVCLNMECQIIFVPCGHLCCCSECSVTIRDCPMCRSSIDRKITMVL